MIAQTERERTLANIVKQALEHAEGADADEVATNREDALRAYNTAALANDKTLDEQGLSTVQDTSVRDMVHACLAQITPMLSTDCSVIFEPDGEEDEEQARAEGAAVDHVISELNSGFVELEEAIHDALLTRNGWTKVWCDHESDTERVALPPDVPPEVLAMMMQPQQPGESREMTEAGDLKITRTKVTFRVAAVPPENMRWTANYTSADLARIPFLAELLPEMTRSDLVKRGISKSVADQLPTYTETWGASQQRNKTHTRQDAVTRDQDVIEVWECHVRADLDGDGISELYRVTYSAGYTLEAEEVDLVPYGTGSPFIAPHRLSGMSLYDVLREIQALKTAYLRRFDDATAFMTFGRWAVDETVVNTHDVLSGEHVIRTKGNPTNSILPVMTDPTVAPTLQMALQYMDKLRTERGGAALEMQSAELQIAGETAHGVERQTSLREMLTALMARNLAETLVRRTYLLMHEYLRRYSIEPIAMKIAGQWTMVDPTQWKQRQRINVRAGLSAGEKARKLAAMTQLLGLQMQVAGAGLDGILTDVQSGYNAAMDWATLADIDNPSLYWINPASPQSQQAAQQKQAQAQQQAQQMQQLVAAQMQVEMEKVRKDIVNQERELAFKYWEARLKAETEEAKLVATTTADLEKTMIQGEAREREIARGAANGAARDGGDTQ